MHQSDSSKGARTQHRPAGEQEGPGAYIRPPVAAQRAAPALKLVFAVSFLEKARGLLWCGSQVLAADEALMFVGCSSIHTFGMRSAIDVAFLDADGRVLRSVRHFGACRVLSCRGARMVLERFSAHEGVAHDEARARRPPWPRAGQRLALHVG